MRRREFISLLSGATVVWPLAMRAQEAGRIYRLGCLLPLRRDAPINVAFFDELRRRGFIEGQNLAVEYRAYGLHTELISEYAAELVQARVDVIATAGTDEAIRAAQQATKTIPILAMSDDMVGSGLVGSMARPNGNITGVSILAATLDVKRQEILIETIPGLRRIAFLAEANTNVVAQLDALQKAAREHNIELSIHQVAGERGAKEVAAAIDAAKASGAAALNVSASPLFFTHRQLILDRVAALRLPAIYEWPETAEEGGFAAYGPRLDQLFLDVMIRQLVELFRGVKVADIPIEQPTKFELVINLKTAKALGLTIAESFLVRADKVIE
jgi:putative tryptophan/tyrosine transport system substrate-binding protein